MNIVVTNRAEYRAVYRLTYQEVYIGRAAHERHMGNPFSHLSGTLAPVQVQDIASAVQAYRDWYEGTQYQDVEPERRAWVLLKVQELAAQGNDLALICFCRPEHECHGNVLKEKILESHNQYTLRRAGLS